MENHKVSQQTCYITSNVHLITAISHESYIGVRTRLNYKYTLQAEYRAQYRSLVFYRKINYLTREFHVKFHAKNRYRTNREAMSAISVFQVKFNVEFPRQVIDFP